MSRAVVLRSLLVGLLVGCRTEPLPPPVDGGVTTQPAACQSHTRVALPLQSITLLDPASRLQAGVAVRVALHFSLRPCDFIGDVQVQSKLDRGIELYTVAAEVWQGVADCGAAQPVTRPIVLAGVTSEQLLVSDQNSSNQLTIKLQPRQSMDCGAIAIGQACQLDCQCGNTDRSAICIVGVCELPCAEDVDCAADRPQCAAGASTPYICRAASGGCGACGFGQVCAGGVCQRPAAGASGMCACDSDCGGAMCEPPDHFCAQPCTTDADCPVGGSGCQGGRCVAPM